jgi:hypothetical protein
MRGDYKNQHDQSNQARAAFALQLSGIWGLRTDKNLNDALAKKYEARLQEHIERFMPFLFLDKSGREKESEVKRAVVSAYAPNAERCGVCFGAGKVAPERGKKQSTCAKCDGIGKSIEGVPQTDKGKISTSHDTLTESGDTILVYYSEVSGTQKILQTYLPYLRSGEKYAITTDPNVLLNTGRSSYKGLTQTQPRNAGTRECHVARAGRVFCSVDFSGVELATLAQCLVWICGSSKMADALNADKDLHSAFAADMMRIGYDDFCARLDKGDKTAKAFRQGAKAANFGFPGGMSAPTLVVNKRNEGVRFCDTLEGKPCNGEKTTTRSGIEVCKRCVQLAQDLRDKWMASWPEMDRYFDHIKRTIAKGGTIEQYVSNRVRGGVEYCAACNTLFQGLAADGAKNALYRITKECYTEKSSPLYGSRVLIFIHDETFMEHREEVAHEAAFRQAQIMIDTMREYTPDVKIKAEPALCRRWYKDAKAVYDERGRLQVWEPKV